MVEDENWVVTDLRILLPDACYVARGDQWLREYEDGKVQSVDAGPIGFLVVLERTVSEVQSLVDAEAQRSGRDPARVPEFPWISTILVGLRSESAHWQELALRRLEELGAGADLAEELSRVEETGASQKIRHFARRLAGR